MGVLHRETFPKNPAQPHVSPTPRGASRTRTRIGCHSRLAQHALGTGSGHGWDLTQRVCQFHDPNLFPEARSVPSPR